MLKAEETSKEFSLDKSWGGLSPTKKVSSSIRAPPSNFNQQCFHDANHTRSNRNEQFQKEWERWSRLESSTEDNKKAACWLNLLQNESKKAADAKARLSLAACASDIIDRLTGESEVLLHHIPPRSELLQLILGIKLESCVRKRNVDVVLFTSEELLSHYAYFSEGERNIISDPCDHPLLKIPGVDIHLYENDWKMKPFERPTLVFLDTFMCTANKYLPVYKHLKRGLWKDATILVYSDNLHGIVSPPKVISLGASHPVSVSSDCTNWTGQLCKILKDGKVHALQTDVIVFSSNQEVKNELLSVLTREKVQFKLQTGSTPQDFTVSNVYFCKDEEELAKWAYNYDNVVCVYDEGIRTRIIFDYDNRAYVETSRILSPVEMRRRLACLGLTRPGKYLKGFKSRCRAFNELMECDLSRYTIKMISLGFTQKDILDDCSEPTKQALLSCLTLLKDLKIVSNDFHLERKEVLSSHLRPILVPLFLDHKQSPRLAIILSYVIGLLETTGCLHNDSHRRLDKIWMKSGDLSSGVEILSLLQRIIINKGPLNSMKKEEEPQAEITEGELEMFGFLYEELKPKSKLTITEMTEQQFVKELDINKTVAYESLRIAANIRKEFGVQLVDFELTEEDVDKTCEVLFVTFNSFGFYTGSRMQGYRMSRTKRDLLPAKNSLLVKLNSRPLIILPLKLAEAEDGKLTVLTSNKISDTVFLAVNGELPIMSVKSSFGDKEIEFNNISNALFDMLWRNKGELIADFEKANNCMVESNNQASSILIFCERQQKDKIEKEFKALIDRYNKDLLIETKLLTLNNLKLVCQKGGSIKEIFAATEDRCLLLSNLPADTTEVDVKELIEDYAPVEKVELKPGNESGTKTAVITFAFKKDIFNTYNELNFALYDGRRIYFEKSKEQQERKMVPQSCLIFKWYVWRCNKKGSVQFSTAEAALKAKETFEADFDGRKVRATLKDRTLQLDGLNEQTDETFLQNALEVYGEIIGIHLDKHALDEPKNSEHLIQFYIKEYTSKDERFHIKSIKKMAQGLRSAKISMNNPASIPVVCSGLNAKKGLMGQTRLYVTPYYSHPFLIAKGMDRIFGEFLEDAFVDSPPLKQKIETSEYESNGKHYIIVKSKNQDAFNLIVNMLTQKLKERELHLNEEEKTAMLSEQGIAKLQILQQKFLCKFVPKPLQKTLSVICKDKIYSLLYTEVKALALEPQTLRIAISAKTARNMMRNLARLDEFKEKCALETIHLDSIGKSLVMEGKAKGLQTARENVPFFLEGISKSNEENVFGVQTCEICCDELNHPYRLQGCGDCFCLECLMASVNNSFADATTFPIKCPNSNCREFLIVRDLINLFDEAAWAKLRNIAINDFVNKNSDKYIFCFTGNCQGIHPADVNNFECEVCQKAYCTKCKMETHKGMTCEQAKNSTEVLLKKFMEEEDVRICPNPTCKMLLQWVDGCYRVTCSRCQQSMCWKCPRDNMPIYKTAEECYKHLTDKHGGYW